jgi:chloride channel protein, CIC family
MLGMLLVGIHTGINLGDVARPNFTILRENDIAFEVIQRVWRKREVMALVVPGRGVPRSESVVGVITMEHVAYSVAASAQIYTG